MDEYKRIIVKKSFEAARIDSDFHVSRAFS